MKRWSILSVSSGLVALALAAPGLAQQADESANPPADVIVVAALGEPSQNTSWYRASSGCASGSSWELRANALFLHRDRPNGQRLVTDPAVNLAGTAFIPGPNTLLDANQFGFGYKTGFEVDLVGDHLRGTPWGLEVRYFRVGDWNATADSGLSPVGSIVLYALPIGNNAFPVRTNAAYTSRIDSFEFDFRRELTDNITVQFGYRHVNLSENGGLAINQDVGPGLNLGTSTIQALNRLDGFQVGADATLWRGRSFTIEGVGKAGIYSNSIHNQARTVQLPLPPFSSSADDTSTAFVGELGLTGVVQLTPRIALRAGYQVMWVTGVATAARQLPVSSPFANFPGQTGTATVDSNGGVFYHGASVGLSFRY